MPDYRKYLTTWVRVGELLDDPHDTDLIAAAFLEELTESADFVHPIVVLKVELLSAPDEEELEYNITVAMVESDHAIFPDDLGFELEEVD